MENKPIKTCVLKAGRRTYFFDVNLASNNKRYLRITESQAPAEGEEKGKRNSFLLFQEDLLSFQRSLNEIAEVVNQTA